MDASIDLTQQSPPILRRAAKAIALAVDSALPATSGVVILAYHRVGARTRSPVDLELDAFRRQLDYLVEHFRVISLDDALTVLTGDGEVGPSVVLTFDDGTADFADVVVPELVERNLHSTLYLTTSAIDDQTTFPDQGIALSWESLRDVHSTGLVNVGAHTHTHRLLDRCDEMAIELELDVCNERIATEIGVMPEHFAYPKAVAGSALAEAAVRRRYRSAALAGTRANPIGETHPWRLRRSPVQVADGWSGFVRKVEGGMGAEDDVRGVINLVRYRGRVS